MGNSYLHATPFWFDHPSYSCQRSVYASPGTGHDDRAVSRSATEKPFPFSGDQRLQEFGGYYAPIHDGNEDREKSSAVITSLEHLEADSQLLENLAGANGFRRIFVLDRWWYAIIQSPVSGHQTVNGLMHSQSGAGPFMPRRSNVFIQVKDAVPFQSARYLGQEILQASDVVKRLIEEDDVVDVTGKCHVIEISRKIADPRLPTPGHRLAMSLVQ